MGQCHRCQASIVCANGGTSRPTVVPSSTVPRNDDIGRFVSLSEDTLVGSYNVLECGGKRVLRDRGETVARRDEHTAWSIPRVRGELGIIANERLVSTDVSPPWMRGVCNFRFGPVVVKRIEIDRVALWSFECYRRRREGARREARSRCELSHLSGHTPDPGVERVDLRTRWYPFGTVISVLCYCVPLFAGQWPTDASSKYRNNGDRVDRLVGFHVPFELLEDSRVRSIVSTSLISNKICLRSNDSLPLVNTSGRATPLFYIVTSTTQPNPLAH